MNKNKKIVIFLVLFIIMGLSVGYSFLSTRLSIEEIAALVRVEKDVRVTGVSVESSDNDGLSNYEEYNVSNISAGVYLPNSDSSVIYKVDITNFEASEIAIFSIDNLPDNLEYVISNYTLKDKICDSNNKCNLGITKDIYITIKYKEGGYDSNNLTYNINLEFDLRKIYQVSYNNVNIENFIEETFEGDSFAVKLPYDTSKYLKVTMGDQELVLGDNYTYDTSSKLLSIYNVTGDIVIEYTYTSPAIVMPGDYFVPIWYNGERWKISSKDRTDWYDYDNQEWANGAILTEAMRGVKESGDSLNVSTSRTEAMAMFVWIPRFEYKIEGTYGTHTDGTAGTASTPGEILVNFIPVEQVTPSEGYTIHPAFKFGNTQLAGFWAGKFETSHSTLTESTDENNLECTDTSCSNADGLVILPGLTPLGYNNVSNFFFAARSMSRSGNGFAIDSSELDSHMMKNSEWGAIAYLSQSKYGKYGNSIYTGVNKEVYQNKSTITGNSNGTSSQDDSIDTQCSYDDITDRGSGTGMCGGGASTTGNIYGIYDMSGSYNEYMVGYLTTASDTWGAASGGNSANFSSAPASKYFDGYTSATSSEACNGSVCKGHALDEVAGWYGDSINFINEGSPWMLRGGAYDRGIITGPFYYSRTAGAMAKTRAFRVVLSTP